MQNTISASDLPARGEPLAGGVFVTRYWLGDQERALVLLPDELEGAWGEYGQEVATNHGDGEANTRAMAEAGSEIAKKALELGGHIPSCAEGHLLMAAKEEGLITLREDRFHWLSTQYSAYDAYSLDFELAGRAAAASSTGGSSARSAASSFSNSIIHSFSFFG